MRLSQAVEDYAVCAWREVNHSRNTYLNYRMRLREFARWLAEKGGGDWDVGEIDYPLCRRYYLTYLKELPIKNNTLRGHLHALRFLFDYLFEHRVIDQNPWMERDRKGKVLIPLPNPKDAQRLLISDEEMTQVLEAAGRQASVFKATRDRAVIALLMFTAIRRSELLGLSVEDINRQQEVILVLRKGNKRQSVPLNQEALRYLTDWLSYREQVGITQPKLFTVDRGRPLGQVGLKKLIEEAAATAGLKGGRIKPHSMRHCAATRFLNNGATLKDCQILLGHESLKTTALYLHADELSIRPLAHLLSVQKPLVDAAEARTAALGSRSNLEWRP